MECLCFLKRICLSQLFCLLCMCVDLGEFFTQIPVCFLLIPFMHQAFEGLCAKVRGHQDEWAIEPAWCRVPVTLASQKQVTVVFRDDWLGGASGCHSAVFCHPRLNVSVTGPDICLSGSSFSAYFPVAHNLTSWTPLAPSTAPCPWHPEEQNLKALFAECRLGAQALLLMSPVES